MVNEHVVSGTGQRLVRRVTGTDTHQMAALRRKRQTQHEKYGNPRMGCEAALAYPYDITRWAFERGLQNNGKIILVSSSATLNPVPDKHFFLSQIYYTALEELVRLLPLQYSGHGARISVWHPGVVLTERTLAYAKTIDSGSDSLSRLEASKILATEFGETTVPTAAQYVSVRLRSKKK